MSTKRMSNVGETEHRPIDDIIGGSVLATEGAAAAPARRVKTGLSVQREATPFRRGQPLTYRAAVLTGPGTFRLDTLPLPEPGPRQVRIRLEGCGVCGSNLAVWEGRPWFKYPFAAGAPGHEGWGRIDAAGDEATGVQVGQRVAALSYHAFAEYDLADAQSVVVLPPALDGQPFPGEALGCAMNVFRRADIRPGQNVAIVGIGFLGALLTSLAARAGARVIAISRRASALDVARRMGASDTIPLDDHQSVIASMHALTAGEGCERAIEATGFQWPLDLAGELTAVRGKLIIAGYHQDGTRQVNLQLWNWRGLDVINAHERDAAVYVEGMRAAVDAVASRRLDPTPLYTDSFKLDQLATALDRLRDRSGAFLKGLVRYE
jgi:threonine dehydrogenase-like Zn-dependent dehydrogenase